MANSLFLSFFADGPYWADATYLPSLPFGTSYIHEFRYDDRLVHNSLKRANISKPLYQGGIVGTTVILAARFLSVPHKGIILPIRKAIIIKVNSSPNLHQYFFKLGPMINFVSSRTLNDYTLPIPNDASITDNTLAFEADVPDRLTFVATTDQEHETWEAYCDLVANSNPNPFHANARNSLFLRLEPPKKSQNGAEASCGKIRKSISVAETYGYKIDEYTGYDLIIRYRIPSLITTSTSPGDFKLSIKSPTDKLELSTNSLSVVGNYGSAPLSMRSSGETEAFLLEIEPPQTLTAQNGAIIHGRSIRLPVIGTYSLLQAVKRRWIPSSILFLSLLVLSSMSFVEKLLSPLLQNQIKIDELLQYWPLLLAAITASALATFSIQAIRAK